jgi:glucosamine-6-phosphate deaminase
VEVVITESVAAFHREAARWILGRVRERPGLALALPTGSTPEGMYRALVTAVGRGETDLSGVTAFALDEYVGLARCDPRSFASYLRQRFLSRVAVRAAHLLDGAAPDPWEEARRHERSICRVGRLDLAVLGLGRNGHIAFNEPGSSFDSRTRVVTLTEQTRRANARFFGTLEEVPERAITVGIGNILEAEEILVLAAGQGKEEALRAVLEGPETTAVPASALREHPRVTILVAPRLARRAGLGDGGGLRAGRARTRTGRSRCSTGRPSG